MEIGGLLLQGLPGFLFPGARCAGDHSNFARLSGQANPATPGARTEYV
jgi:hypothetical protein